MDSFEPLAGDSRPALRSPGQRGGSLAPRAPGGRRAIVVTLVGTLVGMVVGTPIGLQAAAFAAPGEPVAGAVSVGEPFPGLGAALTGALSVPGSDARVELLRVTMPTRACGQGGEAPGVTFEVSHPIQGTGRVAVKFIAGGPSAVVGAASAVSATATKKEKSGVTHQPTPRAACTGWLWADVRVMGPTPVALRSIRAGEPVTPGAVRLEEREIRAGQAPAVLGADVVADRLIAAGQVIEPSAVRAAGPRNGEALKVVLVSGGLQVEQLGHALACGRAQCAVLPSGKHVEGTLVGGRLMVTVP
jgi:hypothetical protein